MPHITSPAIHEIIGANHTLGALAGLADRVVMTDPTGNGLASRRASNDPTDPGGIVARDAAGRIKAVAGVAADDVATFGQVPTIGNFWKEILLTPNQNLDFGGATAGIRPLQILRLTAPLGAGAILQIERGASYTFTEGGGAPWGWARTGTVNGDIAALNAVINANLGGIITCNQIAINNIDAVNNILEILCNWIVTDFSVWDGNGFGNARILNSAMGLRVYESIAADMVALPVAAPGTSNGGFGRLLTRANVPEAHPNRRNAAVYMWDNNGNWTAI